MRSLGGGWKCALDFGLVPNHEGRCVPEIPGRGMADGRTGATCREDRARRGLLSRRPAYTLKLIKGNSLDEEAGGAWFPSSSPGFFSERDSWALPIARCGSV